MTEEIVELLIAKLDESATPEQEKALDQWLQLSKENRDEFDRIKTLWSKSGSIKHLGLVNKNRDWHSVKTKVGFKQGLGFRKWAIAASIVLIVSVAATLQYFNARPTVYQAGDKIMTVTLADGSDIVLNKASSLSVSSKFGETTRSVSLTGEAFFEITKDPAHPFHIEAQNTHTQVLGTAFNIDTDDGETTIQVDHGLVKFSTETGNIKLSKGMGARAGLNNLITELPSNPNAFAWRTGILTFSNSPLTNAVAVIADHFDLEITLSTTDNLSITSTFDNQEVQEVLEEICLIHGLTLTETSSGFAIQE